jgi:hypothetical protein
VDDALLSTRVGQEPLLFDLGSDEWRRPPVPPDSNFLHRLWTGQLFLEIDTAGGRVVGYEPNTGVWVEPRLDVPDVEEPVWGGDRIVGWPADGYATLPIS